MTIDAAEAPMDMDIQRKHAHFTSFDEKYDLKMQRYHGQQYSHLYFCRLQKLRGILSPLIHQKWPSLPVRTILSFEEGERCVVVGTLYKQMKLKPSILDEYSKERSIASSTMSLKYVHPTDHLVLEDESGRVKLVGDAFSPRIYVTGVVVAVCGREGSGGDFIAEHILELGLPTQGLSKQIDNLGEPKYVAFISGIKVGDSSYNPLQFQLLVDHLTGHLGEEHEQSLTSQIVRVVICGDSIDMQYNLLSGQSFSHKDQAKLTEPVREFDLSLTELVSAMPVDIMPGPNDPANFSLPQQPLHRCLFPGAAVYNTFYAASNPHEFELDGMRFLGTSGQNIDDLDKYSDAENRLDLMERTLRWRHLAPTAPDTLGCYPYADRDPFVIDICPHVYFCGNQDRYDARVVEGPEGQRVKILLIPRFSETGSAVLLNLRDMNSHEILLSTAALQTD